MAATAPSPSSQTTAMINLVQIKLSNTTYLMWKRQLRKLASMQLFSNARIELHRHVRVSETEQFMKILWEKSEKKETVDMKEWFGDLSMNVAVRMVAGKRFHGGDEAEETRRCRRVMRDFFHMAGIFVPADALPYLGWLDLGGHEKRMKKAAAELDDVVGEWLAEHRRRQSSGEFKPRDFMDVMLSAVEGADFQCEYDVDTIIKATCGVKFSLEIDLDHF